MARQAVSSLEYVKCSVAAETLAGLPIDPTGDTVQMAFTAPKVDPQSGDWQTGTWATETTPQGPIYVAACLVGPGGTIALTVGLYWSWVKVVHSPEVPVKRFGTLAIF